MKRLIAIGDIHGHLDKLNRLLVQVDVTTEDQLVFLGDYIDRGPDSCGVIDRLLELQEEFPQTVFLRGNHEQMLLDALIELEIIKGQRLRDLSPQFREEVQTTDLELFLTNGGRETLDSYGVVSVADGIPERHIAFLKGTGLWWRLDPFLFVHAGLEAGLSIEQQDLETLLWSRWSDPGKDGEIHVVGHHPTTNKKPLFEEGRYSLDTGAAYGHALTVCDVLTRHVWQED